MSLPALKALRMGYRDLPTLQVQNAALAMSFGMMPFPIPSSYPQAVSTGIMSSLW